MTDWIDIIFIYDEPITAIILEAVFNVVHQHGGRGPDIHGGEFNVRYDSDELQSETVSSNGASELLAEYPESSTHVEFDEFQLWISRSNDNPAFKDRPHLTISEEITPLQESLTSPKGVNIANRRTKFATLLADIVEATAPTFGFGGRVPDAVTYEPTDDEIAGTNPSLFEYTLFNETAVEQIGRQDLLDSPVWFIEQVTNGSIFMILREPPKFCPPSDSDCQTIADELNLPLKQVY